MTKNEISNNTTLVAKKRGRKSKKDIENAENLALSSIPNNINVVIEETPKDDIINNINSITSIDNLLTS